MLKFVQAKATKEEFYGGNKPIKIWYVNADNISRLVETKNNSKYLIGYLDKVMGPLVLVPPSSKEFLDIQSKYRV